MPTHPSHQLQQLIRRELLNPYPRYLAMRRDRPVHYDKRSNAWSVFRYDDVARVLTDATSFSSHFRAQASGYLFRDTLIDLDPPRHRQLRALVDQAFRPRATEALAPRIQTIAHDLLDRALPAGRMDVIADIGYPLPLIVIAELLGVPFADHAKLKRWSDQMVSFGPAARVAHDEMASYLAVTIEAERRDPKDNVIGHLLRARVGDEQLSPADVTAFCSLMLVAGHETTTHLIGNLVWSLLDNPEAWSRLQEDPGLVPHAIEEALRYRSPITSMPRIAAADTTIDGRAIKAGTQIHAWIGSANRDEARFNEPDQFKLDRVPNPHLAFGRGGHFCLGASLARIEGAIFLTALLERVETIAAVPDTDLEPVPSAIVYGVRSLPITFSPRSRR